MHEAPVGQTDSRPDLDNQLHQCLNNTPKLEKQKQFQVLQECDAELDVSDRKNVTNKKGGLTAMTGALEVQLVHCGG